MRRTFQIAAAAAAFPVLALASQVEATVLVLPAPYSAFFIWNNDGTVSPLSNPTADYTGIQQQSELWDDFTPGSSLLAGTIMSSELCDRWWTRSPHDLVPRQFWGA